MDSAFYCLPNSTIEQRKLEKGNLYWRQTADYLLTLI